MTKHREAMEIEAVACCQQYETDHLRRGTIAGRIGDGRDRIGVAGKPGRDPLLLGRGERPPELWSLRQAARDEIRGTCTASSP